MAVDTSALSSMLAAYNAQAPAMQVPQPAVNTTPGPLAGLAEALTGGPGVGNYIQKIGMGMSNMGPTGGDPYLAFAQGFGGTQKFTTTQQQAAAEAQQKLIDQAMAANKALMDQDNTQQRIAQDQSQFDQRMTQDQSQFDERLKQSQAQFDQEMGLRTAAEKRADLIAKQASEKTALEIKRLAKRGGVTVEQQLQIERIAQAAAENVVDPQERKRIVDSERERLTKLVNGGENIDQGPGLSSSNTQPVTATGPNGEKVILKDGQWVPLQ